MTGGPRYDRGESQARPGGVTSSAPLVQLMSHQCGRGSRHHIGSHQCGESGYGEELPVRRGGVTSMTWESLVRQKESLVWRGVASMRGE